MTGIRIGTEPVTSQARAWPEDGLERVVRCPVCGSAERALLYQALTDRVFFCAPGKWTLQRCAQCRSAYLDPRPTRNTIGLAYERYYTHAAEDSEGVSPITRLRRAVRNGYLNHRFGTDYNPSSWLGRLVGPLLPGKRAQLDARARNLPPPTPNAALLDVGCGNGDFLDLARRTGWRVTGVDPDPKAVETARARRLDVRLGGLELLAGSGIAFDLITSSHVIEHVHEPLQMLRACHTLLKPTGFLWLETPNLDSIGHGLYGHAWRDLDPPRHLVLFTWRSLTSALEAAGFARVEAEPHRPLCRDIFAASEAIARGRDPVRDARLSVRGHWLAFRAELLARTRPEQREFITVKVWKSA